nr:hypothetical protein C1892_02085 [Pseudomonas sp. MPBD7-1]
MGASLLAMAVRQLAMMLAVPTSSRASSLPQVFVPCHVSESYRQRWQRLSGYSDTPSHNAAPSAPGSAPAQWTSTSK